MLPAKGAEKASRPDSFAAAQSYGWDDFIEKGIVIGASADAATNSIVMKHSDTPTSTAVGMVFISYYVVG